MADEVLNAIENARYERQNTTYLEDIGADIDEGMVDLIKYFNTSVGHPTKYCCSGLIQDHYDIEALEQLNFKNKSYKVYEMLVVLPYITFEPIYHTWTGENTVIDGEFHTFRDNLPHGVDVHITNDDFETTKTHKHIDFKFSHKIVDKSDRHNSDTHTYNYTCYIGTPNSLSALMEGLNGDIKLYDRMLEEIIEMFQIKHKYPSSIFSFTSLKVDRKTREIQWTLSLLQGYPSDISKETGLERVLGGEFEDGKKLWNIVGSLDQIKEHICGNEKYITTMPSKHPFGDSAL
jgi:hypothetical protein